MFIRQQDVQQKNPYVYAFGSFLRYDNIAPMTKSAAFAFKISTLESPYFKETCSYFNVTFKQDGVLTPLTMFEQKNPLNPTIVAVAGMSVDAELVKDSASYTYNPVTIESNDFLMNVPASNRYFFAKTL